MTLLRPFHLSHSTTTTTTSLPEPRFLSCTTWIATTLPLDLLRTTDCGAGAKLRRSKYNRSLVPVVAMTADPSPLYKMNLNEYMVTLDKPLGIRFALSVDGKFFVHSLQKGGNAERSRIVMVGDTLKKATNLVDGGFVEIKDLEDTKKILEARNGSFSLVLERPFYPFPIQQINVKNVHDILFNKGRVALVTWNTGILAKNGQVKSPSENGNTGYAIFSPKFLNSRGWGVLSNGQSEGVDRRVKHKILSKNMDEVVGIFSEEECDDSEWAFGDFPLEEYIKALDRAKGELCYNHSRGMQYSKITEQIFVGSCIQTEADVETLSDVLGITAVLNFQSESERANWGINSDLINESCQKYGVLMVNYPIREVDSTDLRRKLPLCVGLLLRLLRKKFRVYVTCTTGFDRSPACVIAYLHWIQDTALNAAYKFVTGLHSCRPNRAAIVWATWDLIGMVEHENYDGPPTHVVTLVWTHGCREGEEVYLVGDFTTNWKDSIKAEHKGGPRYEVELRLRHGKYKYKFIVGGQWKHSTSLPTETDERGNVNNVITVGDKAHVKLSGFAHRHVKDPTVVKVIERLLTEDERFLLAFTSRRFAFSICPISVLTELEWKWRNSYTWFDIYSQGFVLSESDHQNIPDMEKHYTSGER